MWKHKKDADYERKTYEDTLQDKEITKNANHKTLDFMVCVLWLFIMIVAVPDAVYMIGKDTVLRSLSSSSVWYIITVLFFVCVVAIYYSYSKRMSNAFSTRFFGGKASTRFKQQ